MRREKKRAEYNRIVRIIFAATAWKDYLYWQTMDKKILKHFSLIVVKEEKNKGG